ncbi:MAG: lysophospholipid acyltransferase family protein [Anaerolineaceae bacterium]
MTEVAAERFPVIQYPRRQFIRGVLRAAINTALAILCNIKVEGLENYPKAGPVLLIANHFSFLDPVAVIGFSPRHVEFIGGATTPNAPKSVSWFAKLYGVLPVRRGTLTRDSLLGAQSLLNQGGVLSIFPEAGSWATVLRPPRPGAALLASRTSARVLPIGLHGLTNVFPSLRKGKRATITIRVGKPFGPFYVSEKGETDRAKLDEIGHTMMRHIAELIPQEVRGYYSKDPEVRAAAAGTEIYPWANKAEL